MRYCTSSPLWALSADSWSASLMGGWSIRNPPPPPPSPPPSLPSKFFAPADSALAGSGLVGREGGMKPWFRPGEEALETGLDLIWSHTNSSSATNSRASRVVEAY